MKYVLKPSLEHRSIIRIGAVLWNQENIIKQACSDDSSAEFDDIFDDMKISISKLAIPDILKEKIFDIIKPMGNQVLYWKEFHKEYLHLEKKPKCFFWTSLGFVDKKKMVKQLIKDESIPISKRHYLACLYFLEDDMEILQKKIINDIGEPANIPGLSLKYPEPCFTCFERYRNSKLYSKRFEIALVSGNVIAVKHIYFEMTPKERDFNFKTIFFHCLREIECYLEAQHYYESRSAFAQMMHSYRYINEIIVFLLQQMDEQQLDFAWRLKGCHFLKYFLNWPTKDLFLELYIHLLEHDNINKIQYYNILREFCLKMDLEVYENQKIFRELWNNSSTQLKKFVINQCTIDKYFCKTISVNIVLCFRDQEKITFLLTNMTKLGTLTLIYSGWERICESLVNDKEWDLIKHFIHECTWIQSIPIHDKLKLYETMYKVFLKCGLERNVDISDNIND